MKNNYLYRMGPPPSVSMAIPSRKRCIRSMDVDSDGQKLNGANSYTLHFAPDQFPPVNAFWSLTMYKLPESLSWQIPSIVTSSTRRCCHN